MNKCEGVLNLKKFRELNITRAVEGFKCYKEQPITYWTTALAGEIGELCNMVKKMERVARGGIDGGSSYTAKDITTDMMKEEVGGIAIYLDLLASLLGISLEEAIIETFNSKSEKYGFKQYLELDESQSSAPLIDEDIAIAFCQWSDIAIKNGEFPKNPNGTWMNYRESFNYFINSPKKDIYLNHAKQFLPAPLDKEGDAIKFAEWITENRYSKYWGNEEPNCNKWYQQYTSPDRKYYTGEELYQQFLNGKEGEKK